MNGKLYRLSRLSPRDWVLLVQLVAGCAAIAMALRATSWLRLSQMIISGSRARWLRSLPLLHLGYPIENLNTLVEMASSVYPQNRCLVRSMMLLWLLRARGESAEVILGVRKRAGSFEAHAWTISERGVVGDQAEAIADFQAMMTSGRQEQS